jgi:hypothetical protein
VVVRRADIVVQSVLANKEVLEKLEKTIDDNLKAGWHFGHKSLCIPLHCEPSKPVQLMLEELYKKAGWTLKFGSSFQYNEANYWVTVTEYEGN